MRNSYTLNLPSPRTLLATFLKPLLERLVLWYLRLVVTQQSEINAEFANRLAILEGELRQGQEVFANRLTTLEGELRQGFAGDLRAALERLAVLEGELRQGFAGDLRAALERLAALEGELRQGQDALKAQVLALSSETTARQLTGQVLANQIDCLTELVGSCLIAQANLARDQRYTLPDKQ